MEITKPVKYNIFTLFIVVINRHRQPAPRRCAQPRVEQQHCASPSKIAHSSTHVPDLQVVNSHNGEGGKQWNAIVSPMHGLTQNALHVARGKSEPHLHTIKLTIVHQAIH